MSVGDLVKTSEGLTGVIVRMRYVSKWDAFGTEERVEYYRLAVAGDYVWYFQTQLEAV